MLSQVQVESEIFAILDEFSEAFPHGDLQRVLSLFSRDVMFFGSEVIEEAVGINQLESLLRRIFSRDHHYYWDWKRREIAVSGSVAWLLADLVMVSKSDDGHEESFPYRLTSVFKKKGRKWSWVLFHGSEPVDTDD